MFNVYVLLFGTVVVLCLYSLYLSNKTPVMQKKKKVFCETILQNLMTRMLLVEASCENRVGNGRLIHIREDK